MNRKVLSLSLLLMLTSSAFAIEISDPDGLRSINDNCAGNYTLTGHVNMADESFTPLCPGGFTGVFDGNGKTISNLTIIEQVKGHPNVAFIAVLNGGVIKDLTFDKPKIEADQQSGNNDHVSVAVVVGDMKAGSVENVHVTNGTVTEKGKSHTSADAGGIAGTAESGTISESGGSISFETSGGTAHVGGICGNVTGEVTLTDVSYEGSASSIAGAGGSNVTTATKYGALTVNEKNSVKTAVIDGNYTGSEVIDVSGVIVSSVTFDRQFAVGARSTIMLPFSISVDRVHGGAFYEFAEMSKVDGKWQVGIREVKNGATLVANKPYIFIASESSLTFDVSAESSVTLNTSEMQSVTISSWTFAGTYEYLVVGDMADYGRVYGFSGEAKDGVSVGTFVKGGAGATIKPMRAYLVYNDVGNSAGKTAGSGFGVGAFDLPDEVDVVILDEQGNATERGILDVRTGVIRSGNWYDLQGRRLNSKPTVQGTYYHNGKHLIVK